MNEKLGIVPPPYLISAARQAVNESLRTADQMSDFARDFHWKYRDLSEAEQQPQKDWIERFEAVMAEGRENDWLNWDYDTGTEAAPLKTQEGVRCYDETAEQHRARVDKMLGGLRTDADTIQIRIAERDQSA